MAAGNFLPMRVWDLEILRTGLLPYPYVVESATLAAKAGAPCTIDSNGRLTECATSFAQAAFILQDDGTNAAAAGTPIQAWRITPDILWEVTLNEAWAQNLVGSSYGLVKDATTKYWYLSTANTGNQMTIVGALSTTAIGDTKSRVIAVFNRQNVQWSFGSNGLSSGLGAILASAATIIPTNALHHISGTTTINTITAPAGLQSGAVLDIVADGANLQLSAAGNIAVRTDLVLNQTMGLVWDAGAAKWFPRSVPTVAPTAITASGAITPGIPARYIITKAGVAAMTLAAPTVTTDDGVTLVVTSNTANAHTITATGLLQCGTAAVNLATFAAQAGAGVTLVAYQGKWNVLASVAITFS